jgi:16S rRNA G966 N2-methylase RsmD
MVIVEHMTKTKMPDVIGEFVQKKSKKFGKSSLSYYVLVL